MKVFKQNCYNTNTVLSGNVIDNLDFKIEDYLKGLYFQVKAESFPPVTDSVQNEISSRINNEIFEHFHVDLQLDIHLLEEFFITSNNDLFVLRHLRYFPALFHTHNFFEILCVVEGSCTHYINGQQQLLFQGDILIMAPGTMHAINVTDDESLVINILIRSSTFHSAFFNILSNETILGDFF